MKLANRSTRKRGSVLARSSRGNVDPSTRCSVRDGLMKSIFAVASRSTHDIPKRSHRQTPTRATSTLRARRFGQDHEKTRMKPPDCSTRNDADGFCVYYVVEPRLHATRSGIEE